MRDASLRTIQSLFEEQVVHNSRAVALIHGDQTVTYEELNQRGNRCARHLLERGVRRDDLVAVCLPRSIGLTSAIIGILKAGAAYLPLDTTLSPERIREIVSSSGAVTIIYGPSTAALTAGVSVPRMSLENVSATQSLKESVDCVRRADGGDVCCVLFTSGTTAKSRGVVLTHKSVLTRFDWMWRFHPFCPSDITVIHRSSMVIGSVWDTFGALLAGIPAVIVSEDAGVDIEPLWDAIVEREVTRVSASVSLWRALVDRAEYDLPLSKCVRLGISAGEVLDWTLVRRWKRAFWNGRLLNVYGATEVNTPLAYDTSERDIGDGVVPVGRATTGAEVLILGEDMRPVLAGEIGEICVGGPCLALRYLNAPEVTAERFVEASPELTNQLRVFRTGDLGRVRDGNVDVVGRRDFQVKIRGFLVDSLEIERALSRCPGVQRAAVTASDPTAGPVRLTAHLIASQPNMNWRALLQSVLPNHMIPASFVVKETLPLTSSGKIDRLALCRGELKREHSQIELTSEKSEHEKKFVALLEDLLQIEQADLSKTFEDLGGHSLAAVRLVAHLRQLLGVEVSVEEVFSAVTLAALLARIDASQPNHLSRISTAMKGR